MEGPKLQLPPPGPGRAPRPTRRGQTAYVLGCSFVLAAGWWPNRTGREDVDGGGKWRKNRMPPDGSSRRAPRPAVPMDRYRIGGCMGEDLPTGRAPREKQAAPRHGDKQRRTA
ncbi:hypothetical protein GCM10009817_30690 [Terrabacter lapilli]|uniref:Uncharacterized protein n=1 Tax=Terrabacter lapilli TaxID=436231 RepID=A0ABP5DVF9_9MICO